jgi:hypothetical protein
MRFYIGDICDSCNWPMTTAKTRPTAQLAGLPIGRGPAHRQPQMRHKVSPIQRGAHAYHTNFDAQDHFVCRGFFGPKLCTQPKYKLYLAMKLPSHPRTLSMPSWAAPLSAQIL